jgi:hypothetical protein
LSITVAVLNTFGKDFFLKPTFVVEGFYSRGYPPYSSNGEMFEGELKDGNPLTLCNFLRAREIYTPALPTPSCGSIH